MELDEKGTEAAAVTADCMELLCEFDFEDLKRVRFIADRPFLFVIADERNKQIVFIGRMRNPDPEAPLEKRCGNKGQEKPKSANGAKPVVEEAEEAQFKQNPGGK